MDVTPLIKQGAQVIQSYAGGGFRVSGTKYETSIIVMQDATIAWNAQGHDFAALEDGDFAPLVALKDEIDVILLGCGAQMKFLLPERRKALKEQGLHVEVMDTGAACRTYNVLMAEGRRVAAALLPF